MYHKAHVIDGGAAERPRWVAAVQRLPSGCVDREVVMGLYVGSTVLNTADIEGSIAFWTAALGYVLRHVDETFAVMTDPKRRWSNVSLQLSKEPKKGLNRLHLDLYATDQKAEVARLEGLGATRVPWEYPKECDFVVMAGPDGNEFCVIQSPFTQE